jgi:hypothetical protein
MHTSANRQTLCSAAGWSKRKVLSQKKKTCMCVLPAASALSLHSYSALDQQTADVCKASADLCCAFADVRDGVARERPPANVCRMPCVCWHMLCVCWRMLTYADGRDGVARERPPPRWSAVVSGQHYDAAAYWQSRASPPAPARAWDGAGANVNICIAYEYTCSSLLTVSCFASCFN